MKSTVDVEYVSSVECTLCQQLVKDVEKKVVNKKSREQIKHALEHVCDKMRKFKNKCETFIEKNEDKIIDMIMNEISPKEICRQLMLCAVKTDFESKNFQ